MLDRVRGDATDSAMLADMMERVGLNEILFMLSELADDYRTEDLRRVRE